MLLVMTLPADRDERRGGAAANAAVERPGAGE
jgi:hypothetical protein